MRILESTLERVFESCLGSLRPIKSCSTHGSSRAADQLPCAIVDSHSFQMLNLLIKHHVGFQAMRWLLSLPSLVAEVPVMETADDQHTRAVFLDERIHRLWLKLFRPWSRHPIQLLANNEHKSQALESFFPCAYRAFLNVKAVF